MLSLYCILSRTQKVICGIVAAVVIVGVAVGIFLAVHFAGHSSADNWSGTATVTETTPPPTNEPLPNDCSPDRHPYEEITAAGIRQKSSKVCISFDNVAEDVTGVAMAMGGTYTKRADEGPEYTTWYNRCGTHEIKWVRDPFARWTITDLISNTVVATRDAIEMEGIRSGLDWKLKNAKGVNRTAQIKVGESRCCEVPCNVCIFKQSGQSGEFDGSYDLVESQGLYRVKDGAVSLMANHVGGGEFDPEFQFLVTGDGGQTNLRTAGYTEGIGTCPKLRTICIRLDFISADFEFVKFDKDYMGRPEWLYTGESGGWRYELRYTRYIQSAEWTLRREDKEPIARLKGEDIINLEYLVSSVAFGENSFDVFDVGRVWKKVYFYEDRRWSHSTEFEVSESCTGKSWFPTTTP